MIEFINVSKKYDDLVALNNICLTINDSEIFGLVGQSGAGKSTLLRTINQLEKINSGDILIDGVSIVGLKGKKLRSLRKKIGMIFQNFSLMETQTVYQNIALPLECEHMKKSDIQRRVLELAEIVGLSDKLNNKPRELSGGQKQRVAIARALATNPSIILADEPTGALDSATGRLVMDLFHKVHEEQGKTIVFITHNNELAAATERIITLKDGNIISEEDNKRYFKRFGNGEVSCL